MKQFAYLLIVVGLLTACKKDDDNEPTIHKASFYSMPSYDGEIEDGMVRTLYNTASTIRIGWVGSNPTRGILSFDFSGILPSKSDESLNIEKAVLKVYEQSTIKNPFCTNNEYRQVMVKMIYCGNLDINDYDEMVVHESGCIASSDNAALNEYSLDVTTDLSLSSFYLPRLGAIQFRLELTDCKVWEGVTSDLYNAQWNIFSGDAQAVAVSQFRPVLEITYSYSKNQ